MGAHRDPSPDPTSRLQPGMAPIAPTPRVPLSPGLCGRTSRGAHGAGRAPGAPPASIGFPSPHAEPFVPARQDGPNPSRARRALGPSVLGSLPAPLPPSPAQNGRGRRDAAALGRSRRIPRSAPQPRAGPAAVRFRASGTRAIRDLPGRADTCGRRPTPPLAPPARPSAVPPQRCASPALPARSAPPDAPGPTRAAPPRSPAAPHRPRGPQCRGRPLPQGPRAVRWDKGRRGDSVRPGPVRPAHPRWR